MISSCQQPDNVQSRNQILSKFRSGKATSCAVSPIWSQVARDRSFREFESELTSAPSGGTATYLHGYCARFYLTKYSPIELLSEIFLQHRLVNFVNLNHVFVRSSPTKLISLATSLTFMDAFLLLEKLASYSDCLQISFRCRSGKVTIPLLLTLSLFPVTNFSFL